MLKKRKILFTALNSLTAIQPTAGSAVGGLETFAWAFARALAATGEYEVYFCVRHTRRPEKLHVDGVTICPVVESLRKVRYSVSLCVERSKEFPWISIKKWDPHLIWQIPMLFAARIFRRRRSISEVISEIVKNSKIDFIISLGVSEDTAASVEAGKSQQVPVIMWLQNNCDLDQRFLNDDSYRNQYGVTSRDARACYYSTSAIICQTFTQQEMVQKYGFKQPHVVIPNPIDLKRFTPGNRHDNRQKHVLWVGRYDRFHKRPLLALEIARLCPEIPFLLVINPGTDSTVADEVVTNKPANVTIMDYIPHSQMPQALQQSKMLMSTGAKEFEGFPNVFLESAAVGTPLASLEDFDQFISTSGCGICSHGNLELLALGIKSIWNSPEKWQQHSAQGIDYVRTHHSMKKIVTKFEHFMAQYYSVRQRPP